MGLFGIQSSACLPAIRPYAALNVLFNDKTSPIENLRNASPSDDVRRGRIDSIERTDRRPVGELKGEASMEGVIQHLERAPRMETTTPEIVDISKETAATKQLYGEDCKDAGKNARVCLLARKRS